MRGSVRILSLLAGTFLFGVAQSACAQGAKPAPAQSIIDSAEKEAAAENKAIFIHFSASW